MIDGVDKVFDPNGGDNFKRSVKSLKPGGKLIGFGLYNAFRGKGSIKPEIAEHYPLNKAIEAHKMIENATNAGKIIFDVS